ncbi:hypothetical protein BV20DRAFT_953453 [Pilatotrama ljubarskyi]|nr:hypothetical protein BV20DRAFT_953453 [Pilatotrama ljubarskyi]
MGTDNATTLISPQAVVESQVAKTADRKPSISSLNPSSSRFTLKLPLLGRPKIPLEQAVAVAQAEDIRDAPKPVEQPSTYEDKPGKVATVVPTENAPAQRNLEQEPEQPPVPQSTSTQGADAPSQTQDSNSSTHGQRAASWWDYLAWGTQHGEDHAKTSEPAKDSVDRQDAAQGDGSSASPLLADSTQGEGASSAPSIDPPQTQGNEAASPAEAKEASSPTRVTSAQDSQRENAPAKPSSVFSAETVKSQGSAWYLPWAWYAASPTNTQGTQDESRGATDEASSKSAVAKTESERVKEEALAREQDAQANAPESADASSSQSPTSETTPRAGQGESTPKATHTASGSPNPIESSVANNRSGWMSFFTSKALTVKSVTNESHDQKEDGMEVMEIDDEPQPSAAIAIPTGKDVQRAAAASSLKSASLAPSSPVPPATPKSPTGKTPAAPAPKEREPRKSDPPAAPLTDSDSIKRETTKGVPRSPSPTPSKASGTTPPGSARATPPNFVLPTWEDTFHKPPRSYPPPRHQGAKSKLTGALSYVAGALFSKDERAQGKGKGKEREAQAPAPEFLTFGQELPKALDVLGEQLNPYMLSGGCRIVVIGVAGWSPGAVTRTLAGGLPSSSSKFVNMTAEALERFAEENGFKFKKITRMPLEGDGTIRKKVSRVYNHLVNNEEWMEDLHAADVIFVASHSQGAIISTHLIDRLIEDGHILTSRSVDTLAKSAASIAAGGAAAVPTTQAQKVCLLALCGIHLGPLRYLKTSSLLQPYIQYVENAAARELFEFQDTQSKLSKNYIGALRNVMDHGAKVVYIASLNDQVVPIYSGLFTAASHPRILRALYIDNDAYHSSDFLSNLLILLIRILNAGLSDRGLLAHLSEATAGTLSGVGHSTAYEEPATYSLAVKYFFMTSDGTNTDAELVINPFNAVEEQNDYEIPWLLRDMIADTKIAYFFAREFSQLRDAFDDWQPKTTILREVKKKLQPITRLSTIQLPSNSISKL